MKGEVKGFSLMKDKTWNVGRVPLSFTLYTSTF